MSRNPTAQFRYRVWTLGLLLALTSAGVAASSGGYQDAGATGPASYRSADGLLELSVKPAPPAEPIGAWYSLSRAGEVLWSGRKDFVLEDTVLSNKGFAFGYAYRSAEFEDQQAENSEKVLRIIGLAPAGAVVLDEEHSPRQLAALGRFPQIAGLFLNEGSNRAVARVALRREDDESWWSYSLSTGLPTSKVRMKEIVPNTDRVLWWNQVLPLPDTPFTLLRLSWLGCKDSLTHVDSENRMHTVPCSDLIVLGADWEVLWRSDRFADQHPCFRVDDRMKRTRFPEKLEIDRVERDGRFSVKYEKEALRVSFKLEERERQGDGAEACWDVVEIDRDALPGVEQSD